MSDVVNSAGTGAPADPAQAVVSTPISAPVAAPVAAPTQAQVAAPVVAAAVPPADGSEPQWIGDRVKRARETERNTLLRELGVENIDSAKAAVAAAKAAEDAKKSVEQRAAELDLSLKTVKTDAERKLGLIKEHAGRMMMALSPEQQKAITDFAGDDAEQQLRAIHHFAPTWAAAEAAARSAAIAASAAPVATQQTVAPATTSTASTAPSVTTPTSPADPKSLYQNTRATNPFAAAAYGLRNPGAYNN